VPSPKAWDGLTAYWSFDGAVGFVPGEGEGIKEDTGTIPGRRPLNGCLQGNGRVGKALEMNGQPNACFDYGDSPRLNFAAQDSFTIAGWFRTKAASGVIASQRGRGNMAMLNVAVEQGLLIAEIHQDGLMNLNAARLSSQLNVADGKWHHFALARDNNGNVTLYLDGLRQNFTADPAAKGPITTDLRALGCDLWARMFGVQRMTFQGSVDEFCIFHRNLTPEEISRLAGKKGS
jgi:hypothetical protein